MQRSDGSPKPPATRVRKPIIGVRRGDLRGAKSSRGAGLLVLLILALMTGLWRPGLFGLTATTQVGVDVRNDKGPKTSNKNTGRKTRTKSKAAAKPALGTLIVQTNMACRLTIGEDDFGDLVEGVTRNVPLKPGQYLVRAQSIDGLYSIRKLVQLGESERVPVLIDLKREKAEAYEAARAEEERNRKRAEAAKLEEAAAEAETRRKSAEAEKRAGGRVGRAERDGFVILPAGEFLMGSDYGNPDEKPVHSVRITQSFEMGKYEVTQLEWVAVMGNNPSYFKAVKSPVERVSWLDVQRFINLLNLRNNGYVYRLPTEAEWEYACQAGSANGSRTANVSAKAWFADNSGRVQVNADKLWETQRKNYVERMLDNQCQSHSVGEKQPNAWGLYDMLGNVWEWCQDWYAAGYYAQSPRSDPRGLAVGAYRVIRGGGFLSLAKACHSTPRSRQEQGSLSRDIGFRLVRTPI